MQSLRLISLANVGLQVIRQLLLLDYSLETQQSVIAQVGLPLYSGPTIMCAKFNSNQGTTAEARLPTLCEQMKAAIGFPPFKLSFLPILVSCLSRSKSGVRSIIYGADGSCARFLLLQLSFLFIASAPVWVSSLAWIFIQRGFLFNSWKCQC